MAENNLRHCPVCTIGHHDDDPTHNSSPLHKFNFLLMHWNKNRKAMVRNRHGVEVTISFNGSPLNHNINSGKHNYQITPVSLANFQNELIFKCTVTNRRRDAIILTNAVLLHSYEWFSIQDPNNNNLHLGNSMKLLSGTSYNVNVIFSPGQNALIGNYSIPVCFIFQTIDSSNVFNIARSINVSIEEVLVDEANLNASPFTGNEWPQGVEIYPPTVSLPFSNLYPVPFEIKRYLLFGLQEFKGMSGHDFSRLRDLRYEMSPGNVTEYNYKKFWHNVLWIEEIGQELGLQQYNMENVSLNLTENGRLELVVPGLAEKRPSVIVKDMIDIRPHDNHTGYRGIIRSVNDMTVEIGDVDRELIQIVEAYGEMREEFDVRFVLSRLAMERRHQGIDHVVNKNILPCIFPPANPRIVARNMSRTIEDNEFFNQTIITNEEQKTAVRSILNVTSAPYPYIVFGPPGTGKTVTIVEAILQIKVKTKHNILVCAPSNAACDVITEKLLEHCDKNELLRIMSSDVDIDSVHRVILPFSNYNSNSKVIKPIDSASLKNYRIIVTTLILIGKYTGYYHPDVVFIDEAAQACEPEACIPLSMINKGKQIVLAGDPKQLGPSLTSAAAKRYGLGISLLERLMQSDIYTQNNSNFTTMLIRNFRNHEMILRIPNELFYGNQLRAYSTRPDLDPLSKIFVFQRISGLKMIGKGKNKKKLIGQPIEFCSLISKESREGKSPSYYNKKELQMIIKYICALQELEFENEDDKVLPTDIGVVAPYVRQVHKLKGLLQSHNIEGVEVGTTETFQGREKRIIIITTVRAQKDLLLYDKLYKLGFVKNEKRFNVAITRAMSKLIVIGCAHVLATDSKWLSYIDLCEGVRGFCGAPFAKRTDEVINEITEKLENVNRDTQYHHE